MMSFFKTKIIQEVDSYKLNIDDCLVKKRDKSLWLNGRKISEKVSSYSIVSGRFFYKKEDQIIEYGKLFKSETELDIPLPNSNLKDGYFYSLSDFSIDPIDNLAFWRITITNFDTGVSSSSKEKHKIGYGASEYPFLYCSNSLTNIEALHLPTETTLWQYDTSVLGIEKIGKILGVFGEVLVVVGTVNDEIDTYFPKKDLIFGLDVSSGKVLWKTQTAENYEVNNINGLHYGLKPFKEETIVRALGGNHYFELDTQNGRIQATSLQEQLTLLGLKYLQSSDISSTHLFFKSQSSQGHGLDNCIGSFDYKTKKIDWHHVIDELSETGTTIKNGEPKASANKIYTLDNDNTLHIFERE